MFGNRNLASAKIPSVFLLEQDNEKMILISFEFKRYGFSVYKYNSLNELLQGFDLYKPSAVIIDYESLDNKNEVDMAKLSMDIRNMNRPTTTPIIMIVDVNNLSSYPSTEEGGADEYVSHKANEKLIVATLKSRLKDIHVSDENSNILIFDDIILNLLSYKVKRSGKEIRLGPTEFRILQCLMENPKRTLSREFIMEYVWGKDTNIEPRTIDVHINRLRHALKVNKEHENEPPIIVTIRSGGYTLRKTVIA